ncbi:DUF2255 family protein [Nocardia rhizosphaerae]|uniref:DUF2255 family protein n=1 Tax=Nocardia rhizosphaerae TaxID=1691571 RepID=A0ABV8LBE1_9NOCA
MPGGTTPKTVDIWSVPVGDRIFIRSYNGTRGSWYGPALETGRGRIRAGGVENTVRFVPVAADDEQTNRAVDASYRAKYADSEYSRTAGSDRFLYPYSRCPWRGVHRRRDAQPGDLLWATGD